MENYLQPQNHSAGRGAPLFSKLSQHARDKQTHSPKLKTLDGSFFPAGSHIHQREIRSLLLRLDGDNMLIALRACLELDCLAGVVALAFQFIRIAAMVVIARVTRSMRSVALQDLTELLQLVLVI